MIGQTVSHYRITGKIGDGGMGVVYRAEDTKLGRTVALKFLPPELTRERDAKGRFIQEARAASALQHHNICTIHEIGETPEGQLFIVMDCYEGQTLRDKLVGGPLPVSQAIDIATQVGKGLSEAHAAGMVHRDIKPGNVFVTDRGIVKILDFGLAKLSGTTRITKTGMTVGTVSYMSPEQARGDDVDSRSDVFSLGVLLYELLTGTVPFRGEHEAAVLYGIMNTEPTVLSDHRSDIPSGIDRIARRALAKQPDDRYQSVTEFVDDLQSERLSLGQGKGRSDRPGTVRPATGSLKRFLIPLVAVIAAVLLWQVVKRDRRSDEVGPVDGTAARVLAVMYFENTADREDPGRLGEIATNLLITDLSESENLAVVSSQRLYDIVKLRGKEGEKLIDRETATSVARQARAGYMLLGNILQVEPVIVITSQLIDVNTGTVSAAQRIAGERGEQIFAVIDRLTGEIERDLEVPAQHEGDTGRRVSEITTRSQEAYRYYLEGMDYYNKFYSEEAIASFNKALEHDSTFAMVYYRLSQAMPVFGDGREKAIADAVRYSDRTSAREKSLIECRAADLAGDFDTAIELLRKHLDRYPDEKDALESLARIYRSRSDYGNSIDNWKKVIALDPMDKRPYNDVAYDYFFAGEIDSSIIMLNKYIELAPDEPNPYDSRGELYMLDGQIDKAIASYKKAVELKPDPDFSSSLNALGTLHLIKGEYDVAEYYYRKLLDSDSRRTRADGRFLLAGIPIYRGKLDEAIDVLHSGIWGDETDGYDGGLIRWKMYQKAALHAERGEWEQMDAEIGNLFKSLEESRPEDRIIWRDVYVSLLARKGDFGAAEEVLEQLKKNLEADAPDRMELYWIAKSQIALARGDFQAAREELERIAVGRYNRINQLIDLGVAYLGTGQLSQAVEQLETYLGTVSSACLRHPLRRARAYYYLGIAYEKSGWRDRAIEKYETYLAILKDADPGIAFVEDARRRLQALKNGGVSP